MKSTTTSSTRMQILATTCLLAGSFLTGQTEAKGSSKDSEDDDGPVSDETFLANIFQDESSSITNNGGNSKNSNKDRRYSSAASTPTCGKAGGCVIATGKQVVVSDLSPQPSRTSFAHFSFDFDQGFTEMSYSITVADPENAATTQDVDEAALYCGFAGDEDLDENLIVPLGVDQRGGLFEGSISKNHLERAFAAADTPLVCDGVSITTIAALYQAMRQGSVMFIADVAPTFGFGIDSVRGQVIVPQTKVQYTY
jgi:hypothetical protein